MKFFFLPTHQDQSELSGDIPDHRAAHTVQTRAPHMQCNAMRPGLKRGISAVHYLFHLPSAYATNLPVDLIRFCLWSTSQWLLTG